MKLSRILGATLLLLAAIFGGLRARQTSVIVPASELSHSFLNDLDRDHETHTFTRTGNDPYLWITLPPAAIPVQRVTFEFTGPYNEAEGTFYVFRSPAHIPELALDAAIPARFSRTPDGFTIAAEFSDAKALRLDLPDFLVEPIQLRRVTFHAAFAVPENRFFGLFLFCLIGGSIALVAPVLLRALRRRPRTEFAIIAAVVALKLALTADLPLSFGGMFRYDDALFVRQAAALLDGQWLGPFNHITLSKGPVYPFFLAASSASHFPLHVTQTAFHAFACFVFVLALRPLLSSPALRLLLFAVLLFDPYTFSSTAIGRVLRSGIHPALTLLALAGAIGLTLRLDRRLLVLLPWSLFAGLAVSAFWFCREEGLWLAPSLALTLLVGAAILFRSSLPRRPLRFLLLAAPPLILLLSTATLRALNTRHYGAPITVDVKDGAFPDAYGALTRITPAEFIPTVPVLRETRLRAYAVSPAFAELQPHLEGRTGNAWARTGWENIDHPSAGQEIRGGWFQWALREAAELAGHYRDGATADAYWQRVAQEINAACDDGRLPASPPRRGFVPPWHPSLGEPLRTSLAHAARVTLAFSDFALAPPIDNGTDADRSLFPRITRRSGLPAPTPPSFRAHLRLVLASVYQFSGYPAAALAVLSLAVFAFVAARRRPLIAQLAPFSILLSLAGGVLALSLIVALVDVTSFAAVHAGYLCPATPLALAFFVLAPTWAWRALTTPRSPAPARP